MRIHLRNIGLFFTLFYSLLLSAQVRISSEEELELLRETPMETIYLHTAGNLYMPGEYLYFSLYCVNTQTYKLSELSEVAYVQLIGEDNVVVFTQKIDIEDGRGQGDYFFPTELPSGNYKLITYTHWMKNAGLSQFFMADITFINPYRSDQQVFLNVENASLDCRAGDNSQSAGGSGSAAEAGRSGAEAGRSGADASQDLSLELAQTTYAQGEAVTLGVKNFKGARGYGSYSLSVRRTDNLAGPAAATAMEYATSYSKLKKRIPQRVNDILAIPEQRGELISGQLTNAQGAPLEDSWVALSLPGDDFQVKKVLTDKEGKFYTYLTRAYTDRTGFAELLSPKPEGSNVRFDWYTPYDFEGAIPCFYQFELKEDMAEEIRRRSIYNQIENSYFEVKPDTLKFPLVSDPFDGEIPVVYELEDFTRFATLRETLIEYVQYVWVKRDENGDETFWVRQPMARDGIDYTSDPPLVVVDGILVPQHNALLNYDARSIKSIKVLRGKYQLGSENYHGMVAIETLDNTFLENWDTSYGARFSFLPPSPRKNYFRQTVKSEDIPDFRHQLLWEPIISIQGALENFTFYTSRFPGTYEVHLEGFTTFGKPISVRTFFEVE